MTESDRYQQVGVALLLSGVLFLPTIWLSETLAVTTPVSRAFLGAWALVSAALILIAYGGSGK